MTGPTTRWSRRKEARPTEIIEAATGVFAENGFAAARLDEVARRAGVAKGTLYRYFETKEDLFRAVVQHAVSVNLQGLEQGAASVGGSLAERVPVLLRHAARIASTRVPALARLVIGESRVFPDLAQIWHDNVVSRVLAVLEAWIVQAQQRGEVRAGDPACYAFSIVGPLVTGMLFHEVFGAASAHAPALEQLAVQHAETVLRGMMVGPGEG